MLNVQGWSQLGLKKNPQLWEDLAVGFCAAFGLLLVMGLAGYWLEIYHRQNVVIWDKLMKVPLTATAVSLLEEGLFRGVMLGLLLAVLRPWVAITFVSALYSIVHFLKPVEAAVDFDPVTWTSGFRALPHTFHQFGEPLLLLGGFTTLLAIGVVLALTRLWTASLWLPIGLHMGWIAGNRVFNIFYKQDKNLEEAWMPVWYGPRIEIGLAPLITVAVTGLLVAWWLKSRGRLPVQPANT
jgi:membrane protease YdiL (CAAX protease family)